MSFGYIKLTYQYFVNSTKSQDPSTSFHIYPNPATEQLTISSDSSTKTAISVIDVHGSVVKQLEYSNKKHVLDMSQYSSGIYLFSIRTDRGTNTRKVVKL